MIQIWALYRQSGSDRLEKQPTDLAAARTSFVTQHSACERFLLVLVVVIGQFHVRFFRVVQ
jgi:hypothetical protein